MGQRQHSTMHPDENLIAAFAERTLAPAERGRVLEHLSHCTDCRDAVFLAQLAEGEPASQTALLLRPWGALRWRWASASAAGLASAAVIVSLLLVHRHAGRPGERAPTQETASGQGASPAPAVADSQVTEAPIGKVATARKPALHARAGSIAPSAEAGPSNAGVAASTPRALTSPAASSIDGVLRVGADVAGSVLDPSGAAIPGAKVLLRLGAATTRQATTDPAGRFAIPSVPPGSYTVEFIAPGFQTVAHDIDVRGQDAALSEILAPGSASQMVTADAAAVSAQIETKKPEADGANKNVAVNGRSFSQLVHLAPGVANQTFSIEHGVVRRCIGQACTTRPLPSPSPAVSIAFDGKTVIVVDASGNLFSMVDAGEHWVAIKPQWQGKATDLKLASPPSDGVTGTQAASSTFALTTDRGQLWLSSDEGQTWHTQGP